MSNQTFFGKEIRTDIRDTQVTQIYKILVDEIASERWPINSRFPSVTQLVNQTGLSRGSIQKVLARLEKDSLIATESRRGTFVIGFKPSQNPEPEFAEEKAVISKKAEGKKPTPSKKSDPSPLLAELAGFAGAALRAPAPTPAPIPAPIEEEPQFVEKPSEAPTPAEVPAPAASASTESPSPLPIFDSPSNPFAPSSDSSSSSTTNASPGSRVSNSRIGIALVKSDPRIQSAPHHSGETLLEALLEGLPDFGYRTSVAFLESSPDWAALTSGGGPFDDAVDGIITFSSGGFVDFTEPQEECCPVVFISGAEARCLPSVTRDFSLGTFRATQELLNAGHNHIVACPEFGFQPAEANAFLDGHRDAMRRVGLDVNEEAIAAARGLQSGDFASLRQFLQQFRDATAILCGSPRRATDLIALCDALGVRVPEDLSIATCGRTPMRGDLTGETVTGFEFPPEKLAHAALLLLDEILHTGSSRFTQVRIPPVMIPGNSIAPPRQ